MTQRFWSTASHAVLALLAVYGLYASLWAIVGRAIGANTFSAIGTAVATAAILLALWRMRAWLEQALDRAGQALTVIPWSRWLLIVLVGGIAARLIWFVIFPAEPVSDGRTYLRLAEGLLSGTYGTASARAHWPPGLPLGLMPAVALFGPTKEAAVAHNMLLTVVFLAYTAGIARRVLTEGSARLVLLVALVWPALVTHGGLASKEFQVTALLVGATYHYLRVATGGRDEPRWWIHAWVGGVLIGLAALTQTGMMLVLAIMAIAWIALGQGLLRSGTAIALSLFGFMLVMAPWTLRNYAVFDEFVLVSTNSGSVAYRANHDLANGGYLSLDVPYGELGEVEQSRQLRRDAHAWIADNPDKFARLAVLKQLNLLGEHGSGLYATLRHAPIVSDQTYAVLRMAVVALGGALYALIAVRSAALRWHGSLSFPIFLTGAWTYVFLVHSLYEAGDRHLLQLVALMLIFAVGSPKVPATDQSERAVGLARPH